MNSAPAARHEDLVRFGGFLPGGVFLLVYCFAAWRALPRSGGTTLAIVGIALDALGGVMASGTYLRYGR